MSQPWACAVDDCQAKGTVLGTFCSWHWQKLHPQLQKTLEQTFRLPDTFHERIALTSKAIREIKASESGQQELGI